MFSFLKTDCRSNSGAIALKFVIFAVCIVFSAAMFSGCAVFGGKTSDTNSGTSLSDFTSNLMPLPPTVSQQGAEPPASVKPANDEDIEPQIDNASFTNSGEPILRTGYILRITVSVGDKVEVDPQEVQVSDKNEITLPLVGKVDCNGLTINGLRSRLVTRYGEFFRSPEVTASFVVRDAYTSPWGRVYVQGRVNREGWVSIPATRYLTVSDAIQSAGGFGRSARRDNIRISRRMEDGNIKYFRVNLEEIGRKGKTENDKPLKSGDVVYVYESNL